MRNVFYIALCGLCMMGCAPKRPAVVERPVFDLWSSTTLEIDRIELLDTATVFHIDAYFTPNYWIMIAKETYIRESGSSEKLMITGAEGITLGVETFMPESGTMSFKLFFPALDRRVTKIDFMESDCPDCFKIWGIQLLPGAKVEMERVAKVEPTALPDPGFDMTPAKISGRFLGYKEGMTPDKVTVHEDNVLTGSSNEVVLPIAANGSFSGILTPGMPCTAYSSLGMIFVAPGADIRVTVDLKKRSRYQSRLRMDKEPGDSIYTYIEGSAFQTEDIQKMNSLVDRMFDFNSMMTDAVGMTPDEFKVYVLGIMNKKQEELIGMDLAQPIETMGVNLLKLRVYTFLMQYEDFITAAYMRANNISRADRDKMSFKAEKPGMDYYAFLKGELNDGMSYLSDFSSLATGLMAVEHFLLPGGKNKSAGEQFAYFKERFSQVTGMENGLLPDMIQARFYGQQLEDMKLYTDAAQEEIRSVFKEKPVIARILIDESKKLAAVLEANKDNAESIHRETPMVSQEKVFDAILSQYKGKAVVVDFWATWCGPCMAAMKAIKPLKEEMKSSDVVFLYLTGETSPMNNWLKTYSGISGEHYRVSDAQWSYWYKAYSIEGIPTYIVYNRQGKQTKRYTGFPGVERMKVDIEEALR
jgi:thiol-disulfide isomerase/thioredoxin